jgi:hypothetical protein
MPLTGMASNSKNEIQGTVPSTIASAESVSDDHDPALVVAM